MEVIGDDTHGYWASAHWGSNTLPGKVTKRIWTSDLSQEFHVFGAKWTENEISWFFDGQRVSTLRTPVGFDKPMYLVVNLAVGGDWPGTPDSSTHFPAEFQVDYVRIYLPQDA